MIMVKHEGVGIHPEAHVKIRGKLKRGTVSPTGSSNSGMLSNAKLSVFGSLMMTDISSTEPTLDSHQDSVTMSVASVFLTNGASVSRFSAPILILPAAVAPIVARW